MLLLLFLPWSCLSLANSYAIETHRTADGAFIVERMARNYLGGAFRIPGSLKFSGELNFQRTRMKEGAVYSIYMRVIDPDWVWIKPGFSLEMDLDGKILRFQSLGGSKKFRKEVKFPGNLPVKQETAYWHQVSSEQVRSMLKAKRVRIKVLGEKKTLYYFFTDKNRANLNRFYKEYMSTEAGKTANETR